MNEDKAYRVRDVAAIFSISERFVWRLIKDGKLRAARLGKTVRIFESEIAQYRETLRS